MKLSFKGNFNNELEQFPFYIVDVGARKGLKREMQALKKYLRLIGFEPEDNAYKKLEENESAVYINSVCYDKENSIVLHITECEGLSSVFMPNYEFLSHFSVFNVDGYRLKNRISMKANRLDNMLPEDKRHKIDFIKIDVEGAASHVIKA